MAVYWTIAIITVLISLYPAKSSKQYSILLIVSLIPLFLYGATRLNYGLDYNEYETYFNSVKLYGFQANERMEIGYFYLNKLLPNFRSLLIFQSILLCVSYYYLFKWYIPKQYAWLGFILLFLAGPLTVFFMLSGIRNGIAICILILSSNYIQKRKILPFAIAVFIAYLFHNSIVLYAPIAYFVASGKPITKRSITIWLLASLIIVLTSSTIILEFVDIIIRMYFERYSTYVEFAKEQSSGAGLLVSLFSFVVISILLLLFKDKKLKVKENMVVNLTLLFFLTNLLGPLNMRMSQYFVSFFIAGSIIVISRSKNKPFKLAYFVAIFAFLIYSLMLWFKNPYFSYDTYKSILFN